VAGAGATAKVLLQQSVIGKGSKALLAMNQPGGFKCPSCAFPDADERKKLEFCENGAKALAWKPPSSVLAASCSPSTRSPS
jgi:formate dehydrogenase major subunit